MEKVMTNRTKKARESIWFGPKSSGPSLSTVGATSCKLKLKREQFKIEII